MHGGYLDTDNAEERRLALNLGQWVDDWGRVDSYFGVEFVIYTLKQDNSCGRLKRFDLPHWGWGVGGWGLEGWLKIFDSRVNLLSFDCFFSD